MKKRHSVKTVVRSVLNRLEEVIATVLTWVSFVLLLPSVLFSTYYTFMEFDLLRVVAGLSLTVVCVFVNKSL